MSNEHETYDDDTGGDETLDWRHSEGSARVFFTDTEPAAAPSAGALADGHCWVDSNDDNIPYVYDGTAGAFEPLGVVIPSRDSDPAAPQAGQIWLRTDLV